MEQRLSTAGSAPDRVSLAIFDEAARSQGQRSSERRKKWFRGLKEDKHYSQSNSGWGGSGGDMTEVGEGRGE